jgi:undecaprenyl diphosphate synthase
MAEPTVEPETPRHVGIIMDGNGRWAKARGLPRAMGHREGVEAVRRAVAAAGKLGVTHLTLFSFSTENWRRPNDEIEALFDLLRRFVDADLDKLARDDVKITVIGSREGLSAEILAILERAEDRTRQNTRFNLVIAFNYGARDELVRAARRAVERYRDNIDALNDEAFSKCLDTHEIPDPDLIIRTSGEHRISNFLLWQAAYAEFVFLDVLWPDFDEAIFRSALDEYAARERRFGGVKHG